MKSYNVSKIVLPVVAGILILLAALLIIVASNDAIVSEKIIATKPLIMVIYSFLCVSIAIWLFVKAFSENKHLSIVFGALCAVTGLASELYGIYSDKISTGPFGIAGALLIITALSFAVVTLYKLQNKIICTCIESLFILIGIALTLGAIMLLGKEHVVNEAWILLFIPLGLLFIGIFLSIKRNIQKMNKKLFKVIVIGLFSVVLLSYSVAYSVALTCTQNYLVALKLPTALITSAYVDSDTLVHIDFAGEKAFVSTKETTKSGKHQNQYFCDIKNFSEFPAEKS